VFRSLTGLHDAVFDALAADVLPPPAAADVARQDHPARNRAMGAGRKCGLTPVDQVPLAVVWLWVSPTDAVLAYLFGVSKSSHPSAGGAGAGGGREGRHADARPRPREAE